MIIWDIVIDYLILAVGIFRNKLQRINHAFQIPHNLWLWGVLFLFFMFRPQAQAERPSNQAGALRGSRPRTDIFEQNNLVHQSPFAHLTHIFLFFLIDYKHKHTATGLELHVPHLPPSPLFK